MMILRSTPASPFARKAHIAASVLGLDGEIAVEGVDLNDPGDSIRRQNPLGKIPALLVEDGNVYFDSRVILDYLDHRAGGGRIVPSAPARRFAALRLQALADGIMDASILIVYESRYRAAEKREATWVERQAEKVARALAALEQAPPATEATPTVGDIALACALGYIDFRLPQVDWRAKNPALAAWYAEVAERPSMRATAPG